MQPWSAKQTSLKKKKFKYHTHPKLLKTFLWSISQTSTEKIHRAMKFLCNHVCYYSYYCVVITECVTYLLYTNSEENILLP